MKDTQRPSLSKLSPRQQSVRKKRVRLGTEYSMNNIEDRIREDLSLIRIRYETFDYGNKGRYYTMGYMTALISTLLEAMASDAPGSLTTQISAALKDDNQKLINTQYMPVWNKFFIGRTEALGNSLSIIALVTDKDP